MACFSFSENDLVFLNGSGEFLGGFTTRHTLAIAKCDAIKSSAPRISTPATHRGYHTKTFMLMGTTCDLLDHRWGICLVYIPWRPMKHPCSCLGPPGVHLAPVASTRKKDLSLVTPADARSPDESLLTVIESLIEYCWGFLTTTKINQFTNQIHWSSLIIIWSHYWTFIGIRDKGFQPLAKRPLSGTHLGQESNPPRRCLGHMGQGNQMIGSMVVVV